MRVICYINKIGGGGAERVMSVLANGLSQRGHDITLVTDYSVADEYYVAETVQRIVLDGEFRGATRKGRIQRTLRRIRQLRRICKMTDADMIVSFIRDSNFRAILATRLLKTKNVISVRIDPKIGYKSKKTAALARMLYPLADGTVFQTAEAQAWFSKDIQEKSSVIFNPVSDVFYQIHGSPLKEKRIVSCGRLEKQKRFDLLINAFQCVCDAFPEYTLEIYGEGSMEKALQTQIDSIGMQNRIFLMGRSKDIPNAIKDASLFVLSSDYEGMPNALMEAMALGLPVISTDCGGGGARALIENGVEGLIVPCGDPEALAKAMRDMLANVQRMKAMGEQAKQKGMQFSADNVVSQWETYFLRVGK